MAASGQPTSPAQEGCWRLTRIATSRGMRALAWDGDVLYASRGYRLLRASIDPSSPVVWQNVARYSPEVWRHLTSSARLCSRLFRDGFHALAILQTGEIVAAVPGAIVTLRPDESEFRVSHKVLRGTRPLHITAVPDGRTFWGEYFNNPGREEVHIYASEDHGTTWEVAYTFPKGAVRHVHNIVYDPWDNCLWCLTGDEGPECRILRASCDFKDVRLALSGDQQTRAVAAIPTEQGPYFSSDTPFESNHIYHLDRAGNLSQIASLNGSSICGCQVGDAMFFSTMVEPSGVNLDRHVRVYGAKDQAQWREVLSWKKDVWPAGLFQYGNAFLPDGKNTSGVLAVSTIAVRNGDMETSLWQT